MRTVIKFLMPSCLFFMAPVMGYSLCVINNLHDDNDIAYINATISSTPLRVSQPNNPVKMGELDYISNLLPFNKACYVVTSATQYKSSDTNSEIEFTIVATPGGDFSLSKTCEVPYPSSWGYPNYAAVKITGNTGTNGPYNCTFCATNSGSCTPT